MFSVSEEVSDGKSPSGRTVKISDSDAGIEYVLVSVPASHDIPFWEPCHESLG
jgi:hypothetical protein